MRKIANDLLEKGLAIEIIAEITTLPTDVKAFFLPHLQIKIEKNAEIIDKNAIINKVESDHIPKPNIGGNKMVKMHKISWGGGAKTAYPLTEINNNGPPWAR